MPRIETRDGSTLWPYGKDKGDECMDKTTVSSRQDGSPKSTIFYFHQDIKWFDGEELRRIKVEFLNLNFAGTRPFMIS